MQILLMNIVNAIETLSKYKWEEKIEEFLFKQFPYYSSIH